VVRSWLRRAWPWIQFIGGIALAVLALWALAGRRDELRGVTHYLDDLNGAWTALAVGLEAASFVAFALVQRACLAAGEVPVTTTAMTNVTLAATAIANSIPAGPVVASVFAFRQYRRRGADDTLAGWTLVAVFVAASISLAIVAAAGLVVAGSSGHAYDLTGVTVGVLGVTLVVGVLFVQRDALVWTVSASVRGLRRLTGWPRGDVGDSVDHVIGRLAVVGLRPLQALTVIGYALANWIFDCACLVCCFAAVGAHVPWRGLLLAYGAGQLAANLPITPGGLGVVEGSITIALSYFGGSEPAAIAAVLLYRILSFWIELPVGWAVWAGLAWSQRRSPVPATEQAPGDGVVEVTA
jgi:uncharacterized protein (TIRG00374 family)